MPARQLTAAALAAVALLSGACGGSTTAGRDTSAAASTLPSLDAQAQPSPPPADTRPPTGVSVLPDLVVDDVAGGTRVNLASLVPSPEPLLVWFWAPH